MENMALAPKLVEKEMSRSLNEWGIRRSKDTGHKEFHSRAIESAKYQSKQKCSKNDPLKVYKNDPLLRRIEEMKETTLPFDRTKAICHVLEQELQTSENQEYYIAEDKLGMNYKPFYQKWPNHITGQVGYGRVKKFEKFKLAELDPLNRFQKKVFSSPKEWFNYIWNNKRNFSLDGTVFEALVAHHLVFSMACHHCTHRNSLRWNGGYASASSWADVVCIVCKSTYEIKSKTSKQVIENGLKFNNFPGGSFRTFCMYPALNKRFLVMVSREASCDDKKNTDMTHRVSIAEIDHVLPRLCDKSFVESGGDEIKITTEVILRLPKTTRQVAWCRIPKFEGDYRELARQVYVAKYGPESWKIVSNSQEQQAGAVPRSLQPPTTRAQNARTEDVLVTLKQSLEALKLTNNDRDADQEEDDWEAMYASD
jgi:hypothetical protein